MDNNKPLLEALKDTPQRRSDRERPERDDDKARPRSSDRVSRTVKGIAATEKIYPKPFKLNYHDCPG